MDKFLTIGFLSKLSLKQKSKDTNDTNAEELQDSIDRAKENLRLFINKQ